MFKKVIRHNRLSLLAHVHVLDRLLARLVQLSQCLKLGPAVRLRLEGEPSVAFGSFRIVG
jgi:hypothetical protein